MLRYVMLWNETENIGTTWNNTAFDRNTKSQANPVLLQLVRYNPVFPIPFLSCLVYHPLILPQSITFGLGRGLLFFIS